MPATPAWPPKSAPRLFVPVPLALETPVELDGPQAHYLARVMRVKEGDIVILCDDLSGEWAARVIAAGKRAIALQVVEQLRQREEVPDFWLCPALLKKDRFDLVLEKATELGVRRIQPVLTRRCVADKLNADRARMVIAEAAEQCARTALPELAEPVRLDTLLKRWPHDRALFFADEEGGDAPSSAFPGSGARAALLVGPEGGFDSQERELVRAQSGARAIGLGPRILRAETAAIAATAVWMASLGDWHK